MYLITLAVFIFVLLDPMSSLVHVCFVEKVLEPFLTLVHTISYSCP